jgi:Short C-terminal domain
MMRRRGGAGIVGTVARTAVIAGTATAVSNRVSDRHYNKAAEKQQAQMADQAALSNQQDMEQMQAQMQAMQAQQLQAAASPPDLTAKLKQLAELNAAGVLSDQEFAAAKAKLLS